MPTSVPGTVTAASACMTIRDHLARAMLAHAADRALMLSVMISAYRISDGGFRAL
jgi:hypothetical protein